MQRFVVIVVLSVSACAARPAGEDTGVTTTTMGDGSTTDAQDTSSEVGPLTIGTTGDGDGDGETTGVKDVGTTGDGDGDCTDPSKLDLPPDFENTPMPDSCTVEQMPWPTPDQYPGCTLCEGPCEAAYLGCAMPAPGQTCAEICPSGDCLGGSWEICTGDLLWIELTDICGYFEIDGQCCSIGKTVECIAE